MKKKVVINENNKRTMKLSIKEGAITSIASGAGDNYITPFALALNASTSQIGLLSAFTNLIPSIFRIIFSRLMEKFSRRKIIVTFVTLEALMWLPILLLSLLLWKNIFTSYLPIILIAFYTVSVIFSAISGPAWFSLMGDIVPEKIRGRYFGARNKITGVCALIAVVVASFILDFFKTKGLVLIGFSILFFSAFIFRFIASRLFKRHENPKLKLNKGYYFTFFQFLKKAPSNNFGRFVIFASLMYFAVNIAGPFFSVYALKELKFSYSLYMLVLILAQSFFSLIFMPIWGKFSDRYGNRELIKIGSFCLMLIPFLWLVSPNPIYLILVPQLISGIGWAAFNLGASNFIYDSVSQERRGLCVAYYNVLIGTGMFLGAILGGFLGSYLTITFMNKLLFIFLISGVLRLVAFFFVPMVKEIKPVAKSNPMLYLKEIRPFRGLLLEFVHDLKAIERVTKKGKVSLELEMEL